MSSEETLRLLPQLLRAGDFGGAENHLLAALKVDPEHPALNAFAAFVSSNLSKREAAINFARTAARGLELSPRSVAQAANLLAQFRHFDEALAAARAIDIAAINDPVILDQVGACFTACEAHQEAEAAYAKLVELIPNEARCRFNLAAAQRFNGNLVDAATNFDLACSSGPQAAEAAYARSLLRKAKPDQNNLDDLNRRIQMANMDPFSYASLIYAKGKELEDLNKWPEAFSAWADGARKLRLSRPYSVEPEVDAINATIDAWPLATIPYKKAELTPVFIVSLPRAGSTLLDRILSNRSDVISAGETEDFIVSLLDEPTLASLSHPVEMARQTANIDIKAVGERYRTALKRRGYSSGHVIDKTPTNFLYAGLIAQALPEAKIIHVARDPRDAAIATFKTLFRDRYFWSYDLNDLATYFSAYQCLMKHWLANWPDRIERINYENLVQNTEIEAQRMTKFLDLEWDPACLDFAKNRAAVSTASAEHVRRPVYASSIGHWKNFSGPLEAILPQLAGLRHD